MALPIGGPSHGQDSGEKFAQFLSENADISNEINPDTARDSLKKCIEFGDRVAQTPEFDDLQRGYLDALTSGCIAYAMHQGQFSDASGDQCSWQYDYTEKLARTLGNGAANADFTPAESYIREELDRAIRWGDGFGCTQNFETFRSALE